MYDKESETKYLKELEKFKISKNIPLDKKIFVCQTIYSEIIRILKEKGWYFNEDYKSNFFNFKMVNKGYHINYNELNSFQIVNRIQELKTLTTKTGLTQNIRNSFKFLNSDFNKFYPRSYYLNLLDDLLDFSLDFKYNKILSFILKHKKNDNYDIFLKNILAWIILAYINENLKFNYNYGNSNDYLNKYYKWVFNDNNEGIITEKLILEIINNNTMLIEFKNIELKDYFEKIELFENLKNIILNQLAANDPQIELNNGNNIWIIKPSGLSRGRGIFFSNNYEEILNYIRTSDISFIIQKYHENSLLISERKFDIRFWVVIRSIKPLEIWVFNDYYVRLAGSSYDENNLNDITKHLTNFILLSKDKDFNENKIYMDNLIMRNEYLKILKEKNFTEDDINRMEKSMKEIAINAIKTCSYSAIHRKNSFEILGFDFLIGNDLKVWLLEVNASPLMEINSEVMKILIPKFHKELIELVIEKQNKNNKIENWELIYKEIQNNKFK